MVRSSISVFIAFGVALFMLVGCGGESSQEAGSASGSQQTPGQAPSGQQAPMPRQAPSSFSPSDAQVEAAGRVYAELQSLQQELIEQQRQRQQQGDTTGSQRKRRAQQRQKMMKAQKQALSEEANLTARQMQQIMRQAQQNPELRKKLFQAIEEAGGRVPQPPQSGQSGPSGSN